MTNEEALNIITQMFINSAYRDPLSDRSNALRKAGEALAKQIPQTPKRFKNAFWEGYSCPECSESVSIIDEDEYETPPYCKWCGIKLDWSDRDV